MPTLVGLLARGNPALVDLSESPSIHALFSRYGLDQRLPTMYVGLSLSLDRSCIGVPYELLDRRAVQDPKVFVGFRRERRHIPNPYNELVKRRDPMPQICGRRPRGALRRRRSGSARTCHLYSTL